MNNEKTILIVEDNPTNLILFQDLLEAKGYKVRTAKTGFEAFDILEEEIPDLILMDIHLPGLDGLSIVKAIRSTPSLAHIKVVGLSALVMESDIRAAMEAGLNGYITKPVSLLSFFQEIEKYL